MRIAGWNAVTNANGPFVFGNLRTAANILSNNATNYIGIRFQGDTGTVGTQYAWLKVRVESPDSNHLKFRILEWAYDDSGAAIAVGATGGVVTPPPVSASVDDFVPLTLLGLGAVGLAAFRRRRDKVLTEDKAKH